MCNSIRIASLVVLLAANAFPQQFDPSRALPERGVPGTIQNSTPEGEVIRELAAEPSQVWQTYFEISTMSVPARKSAFRSLSSSMKASIWRHHALKYLVDHPEFTTEQKAVITDFLSLITPDLYEIRSSAPEWSERVDAPLQAIKARALKVFDAALAYAIFADLTAKPESTPSRVITPSSGGKRRLAPTDLPNCECSTASDWCAVAPLGYPGYKCEQGGCYWSRAGCGAALAYDCTGLCYKQDTGGG